jgi:hypothetical protein
MSVVFELALDDVSADAQSCGFGGLAKDTKGIKAFAGAKKGDATMLNVNLTPGGHGAFRIHVMLDGPYDNTTWKGKEIAVIDVPADAPRVAKTWQVSVPAVEGLKGKHAIYLVAEGAEIEQPQNDRPQWGRQRPQRPEGLFDLHGIGFSKNGEACEPPIVPTVTIMADGQRLNIPSTPIFCSNANGETDLTRYQVYGLLKADSKITVTTSDPSITVSVSPIVEGRATVKCSYQGKEKIYLIN